MGFLTGGLLPIIAIIAGNPVGNEKDLRGGLFYLRSSSYCG